MTGRLAFGLAGASLTVALLAIREARLIFREVMRENTWLPVREDA